MKTGLLRLCGVLLLTSIVTASARAQIDSLGPTVPLSPDLSPSLTADPQTAPVTTLATDLLAPQRPYIFDPSGASLIANSLNPEIYSSLFSSSLVETDTQIRDSSQTGKISPYATAGQRLGLSFSGGDNSGNQESGITSNGSFHGTLTGDNGQSGAGNAYQSRWGASSSFGRQPGESSWDTRRVSVDRMGKKQQNSITATLGSRGDLATADSSNVGNSGRYSTTGKPSSTVGHSIGGSKGRARTNSSGYSSTSGTPGSMDSGNQPRQSLTIGVAEKDARKHDTRSVTSGTPKEKTDAAKNTLTFFPQAGYGQSALEESPFSSPSGVGELHFLNPNIYAATSQGPSLSIGQRGGATDDSLRQAFVQRGHVAASPSHYGLNTHIGADESAKGTSDKSRLQKNAHLSTGILGPENP